MRWKLCPAQRGGAPEEPLSLPCFQQERQQGQAYFFLPTVCLAAAACFFFWSAVLALACFCVDFFCVDFGDLSPIFVMCYCGFIYLRHISFSEG